MNLYTLVCLGNSKLNNKIDLSCIFQIISLYNNETMRFDNKIILMYSSHNYLKLCRISNINLTLLTWKDKIKMRKSAMYNILKPVILWPVIATPNNVTATTHIQNFVRNFFRCCPILSIIRLPFFSCSRFTPAINKLHTEHHRKFC